MKCPICDNEMEVKREDKSFNENPMKEYNRTVLVCQKDDTWITVEVPSELNR